MVINQNTNIHNMEDVLSDLLNQIDDIVLAD